MRAAIRSGLLGGIVSFTNKQTKPSFSPSANPSEVLVKVQAAAINPVDFKLGYVLGPVLGLDFAGTVEQVGAQVSEFEAGDAVFGTTTGSLAEFCTAKASQIAKKSPSLSFVEAAALPTAYVTSLQGLKITKLDESSSVLVIGASGGCGIAAVQLAKAMGCTRIVGICSSKNEDFVKGLGATEVLDYAEESNLKKFFSESKGVFDLVYDAATASGGGEYYTEKSIPLLNSKTGGQYVQLNAKGGTWARRLSGMSLPNPNQHLILTDMNTQSLQEVTGLMEKLGAKPHITGKPFTEKGVKDGFDLLKSRRAKGKIVFDITSSAPEQ